MLRKCLFKTSNRIDLLMPDLKNDFKPPTRLKIPAKITTKYKTMKLSKGINVLETFKVILIETRVAKPTENKM